MGFSDWWNGVAASLSNLYSSLFSSSSSVNRGTVGRSDNARVDLTFPETANYDLLINLYNNTEPGYKLGAFLCAPVIDIPLNFMGFPHFEFEDNQEEFWDEQLEYYNEKFVIIKQNIQLLANLIGTLAVFPWFEASTGRVKWRFIKSKDISDVLIDPSTKQYSGFVTTVYYQFYTMDDKTLYNFKEKTTYTKSKIIVTRSGILPRGITQSVIRKNPTGILPVLFCNRKIEGDFEGHSEIEKIIPLIKAYSQVNKVAHENCLNMKAKLVQEVSDVNTWLSNNGYDDLSEVSIENKDFIVNKAGAEKTEVIVPQHVIENFEKILNIDYWGICQTTGVPEMLWGLQMVGNASSPETQKSSFIAYIGKLQAQYYNPYHELITATLGLIGLAYNMTPPEKINIPWNDIDSLTETERSIIFKNYSDAIMQLLNSKAISRRTAYNILKELLKDKVEISYEDFEAAIKADGELSSYLDQAYYDMKNDGTGNGNSDDDNQDDENNDEEE
jgi:hypothetical protein